MGIETWIVGAVVGTAVLWAGRRAARALRRPAAEPDDGPCGGCAGCPAISGPSPEKSCEFIDFGD